MRQSSIARIEEYPTNEGMVRIVAGCSITCMYDDFDTFRRKQGFLGTSIQNL